METKGGEDGPGKTVFSWCGAGGVLADSDLAFYADEGGNTGANYLDNNQPYYVTAGWLLRPIDESRARVAVQHASAALNMPELKGSQMLRTKLGTGAAYRLAAALLAFATPVTVILEKNFALRIRLVEDFVFHPAGSFFGERSPSRSVARGFVNNLEVLPRAVLELANQYIRLPSRENAITCASALEVALAAAGQVELASSVKAVPAAPAQWWERESIRKRSLSPNVLGFTTLLQALEILGIQSARKISLVHDELPHVQAAYEFYQDFGATRAQAFSKLFEEAGCPGKISHVSAPKFVRSHDELMVQAADVLCGATTFLLSQLGKWEPDAPEERRGLALLLLWGFVEPELRSYFHFIGAEAASLRFGQCLVDLLGADKA